MENFIFPLRITGLLALFGAFLHAIGDVLLLSSKVSIDDYPGLKPFEKLLTDAEKMVVLSPNRLIWGALLGVFATPLVLAGIWQVYQGLSGANASAVLTTVLLFASASIIGAFVHGTFYYLGEYIRALNTVEYASQPAILLVLIASILFSMLVASGKTAFPVWMAAVNPVTMTLTWFLLKRILPQFIGDWTEGAGFNIAYLAFFACTTTTL